MPSVKILPTCQIEIAAVAAFVSQIGGRDCRLYVCFFATNFSMPLGEWGLINASKIYRKFGGKLGIDWLVVTYFRCQGPEKAKLHDY